MDHLRIPLSNSPDFALADLADAEIVLGRNWRISQGYVVTDCVYPDKRRSRPVRMHRLLMPEHPIVDHILGDRLDNRRANLRPATHVQNIRNQKLRSDNTSGFKGVYRARGEGYWRARIKVEGKLILLGHFATPEDASHAYDDAAQRYFGEFARTNAMLAATG